MVHDLHGQQMKSWNHSDSNSAYYGNKLRILGNKIFTAHVTNQRISVYTLDGKTERQIPFPEMPNNTYVSMCAAGRDSVIITAYNPNVAFRFNLRTSTVMWKTGLTEMPFCSALSNGAVLVGGDGLNNRRGV